MTELVMGLGLSGQAYLDYFATQHPLAAYNDRLKDKQRDTWQKRWPEVRFYDQHTPPDLSAISQIIISPGIALTHPLCQQAQQRNIPIVSDVEVFAQRAQAPILAITGTNGKSTTTKLVADLLIACGKQAYMGGNIGVPVMSLLAQPIPDYYVLELSSFQLETTFSLKALSAVILNISDDHLDRHGDLATYRRMKERIFIGAQYQLTPEQLMTAHQMAPVHPQQLSPSLAGEHNQINALAALKLLAPLNLDQTALKRGLRTFVGLPHRCECVREVKGVRWINDSKATNVAATIAAINSLGPLCPGQLILLVGGVGKGQDFSPLHTAAKSFVKASIAFGQDGPALANLLGSTQAPNLEKAMEHAKHIAQPGDWVLLSPACASLDQFAHFAERGDCFRSWVSTN